MMLLQRAFLHFSQFYANLSLYKCFSAFLAGKKQQSSLHAPWAQVCNENRSTAITQKSVPELTQRALHAGFQLHFLVCLYSSSISLCAK